MPEDVEDIVKRRRGWLFLEPLQKLKAGNPVLVNGNDFAVENGRAQLHLDTDEAIARNFVSNDKPFRDQR